MIQAWDTDEGAADERVSLHPLEFEEALRSLVQVQPMPKDEEGADDGDS